MRLPHADLITALNFSAEDLEANRAGHLSDRQRQRLMEVRRRSLISGLALVLAIALVATTLIFAGQQNQSSILTFVGVAVTVCNAVLVGLLVQHRLRLDADLNGGVDTVSGNVRHTIRVYGRVANYLIDVIGDSSTTAVRLTVPKPVFLALQEGGAYHLYRTAGSKMLLSVEEVGD